MLVIPLPKKILKGELGEGVCWSPSSTSWL